MTRFDAARLIAINAAVSLVVATAVHQWMQRDRGLDQAPAFGTLDVAELYRLKESQVTAILVKAGSGEAERLLAIQQAAAFGAQVATIIETLPQECRCLVLAHGALIASNTHIVDLTPDVRRRLGLEVRP
jgi:hypothetical protein